MVNKKREPEGLLDLPRFRVRGLRFPVNDPQDLPGKQGCSSVTDKEYTTKQGLHTVEYVPQIRHFLVQYDNRSTGVTDCLLIHESRVLNVLL